MQVPHFPQLKIKADQMSALNRASLGALLEAADGPLDLETYEQKKRHDFDAPDDAEFIVTAGTIRKIEKLFAELLSQLNEQ